MFPGEFIRTTHSHEHMHMSAVIDVAVSGIRLLGTHLMILLTIN
jgi:hypothetical protein